MAKQTIYHAGIYVRLSQEDMRTGESLSIENQKLILTKYVKEQGWILWIPTSMLRLPIEYNKMKGQPPKTRRIATFSVVDLVLLLEVSVLDADRQSLTLK